MKVVIASCVFPPEPIVSARTSFDVASFLYDEGHDVHVVCPKPSRNVIVDLSNHQLFPFPVDRIFSITSKKSSFISRFLENISFGVSLFIYILRQNNVDAIYANTWPIFATGLLVLASKLKGFKVVISVQDLYPESLVAQGRISSRGFVAKVLLFIDRWIGRNSDHVIVISEGFKDIYLSGRSIEKNKISVIKNWVKSDSFDVLEKTIAREQLKDSVGLSYTNEDVLCVYGGNIGAASGLDVFIEYIQHIEPKIKFIFAGDGTHVAYLKSQIKERGLVNRVSFISPWSVDMTAAVLCSADILLLPTAQGQEFASVPSKLITYMLSSRPVLLIADQKSESAQEVSRAKCGFVISERTSLAINNCLRDFSQLNETERKIMGEHGREYAQYNYSYSQATYNIMKLLIN